ncbi:serine hydrolase domain-containing protein [Olivibacter jilunii]|uniref:serine hydrolase domain-containing protein n=1 Tax=Olivibacter jilunii TaxID=985016 RepID=UPI0010305338|nr:serine hydrolase domain-containing protein [Olivibacter jilunii]
MKNLLITCIFLAVATTTFGQFATAEKFIEKYAKEKSFNGTILVKQGDKKYTGSFGMANFQFAVPNTMDTKFKIASITKLFTAVLIMQLQEAGKLDIHKSIRTYLPDYSGEAGDKVSIFNLLTATSGIRNSESEEDAGKVPRMFLKEYTSSEILQHYCSGKLENEPGKKWSYNNADYIILGKIIEAIYQKPYEAVLEEKLLQPLHMTGSGMCSTSKVVEKLASVYMIDDSTKLIKNDPFYYIENFYAAGAMYSTAEDLLRFSEALYGGHLISARSLKMMLEPYMESYGFGLWIRDRVINNRKISVAERQGSIWGTTTRLLYIPEEKITIILLTNMYTTSLNDFQNEIMNILIR